MGWREVGVMVVGMGGGWVLLWEVKEGGLWLVKEKGGGKKAGGKKRRGRKRRKCGGGKKWSGE
ncbi:hypothetical protein, partial [Corynebacterium glyciniphilum]|uniref:hypothetical protein n=1 Tax=Corynebacterium glyciniphilum TaxID=1404244 RepID=UPI001642D497